MRQAIIDDVADWKKLTDELEVRKANKKMKMLYGHIYMWQVKMDEVLSPESIDINKPLPFRDLNRKEDDDFVYF